MKLRDYPFEVVHFSCGKCLRNGGYKKFVLIEKYTADIPLPDLRTHIAHDCQRVITKSGVFDAGNAIPVYSRFLRQSKI